MFICIRCWCIPTTFVPEETEKKVGAKLLHSLRNCTTACFFFLLVRLLRTQCTQSSWEIRGDMFCCGKEPGARRATWMKLIAGDGLFGELNKNIFTMRGKNGRASLIFRAKDNGIVIVVVGSLNRYRRSINSTKIIYCVPKSTFRSTAHFQFKQNGIFLLHPPFRPNLILCIVTQLT